MWGSPGKDDEPKVTLKVRSVRALKKYAQEPKCLRCGYDLRGQIMADCDTCPECGQACRFEDLADQIAGQPRSHLPIIHDVLIQAYVVFGFPLMIILLGGMILSFIFGTFHFRGDILLLLIVVVVLVSWSIAVVKSVCRANDTFQSRRGSVLWVLGNLHTTMLVISIAPVAAWIGCVLVESIYRLDRDPLQTIEGLPITWRWLHISAAGGLVLLAFTYWWGMRFVVNPCRIRCRELVLEYLQDVHGEGSSE